MSEELTINQAHELSKQLGRRLSLSYLTKLASRGTVQAQKMTMPTGSVYWLVDKASLIEYLSVEHKPGAKPKSEQDGTGA